MEKTLEQILTYVSVIAKSPDAAQVTRAELEIVAHKAVRHARTCSSSSRRFFVALSALANAGRSLASQISLQLLLLILDASEACYASYLAAFALVSKPGVSLVNASVLSAGKLRQVGRFLHSIAEWYKFEPFGVYAMDAQAINSGGEGELSIADVRPVSVAEYLRDTLAYGYVSAERLPQRLYIVVNSVSGCRRRPSNTERLVLGISPVVEARPVPAQRLKKITTRLSSPNKGGGSRQPDASRTQQSPSKARAFMTPNEQVHAAPAKRGSKTANKQRGGGAGGEQRLAFNFNEYSYGHVSIYRRPEAAAPGHGTEERTADRRNISQATGKYGRGSNGSDKRGRPLSVGKELKPRAPASNCQRSLQASTPSERQPALVSLPSKDSLSIGEPQAGKRKAGPLHSPMSCYSMSNHASAKTTHTIRKGSLSKTDKAGVIALLASALKKNSYSIYDAQNRGR